MRAINNTMYPRQYIPNYNNFNQQSIYDQIDNEINSLQQMKEKMKNTAQQNNTQPPSINQTFQLAPSSNNGMKYANTIDDVSKEQVFIDTPFFSKDMSVVWIKNNKGDIKSYELTEIVPQDAKDIQIEYLQAQIEELKGMIKNEQSHTNVVTEQVTTDTTRDDETVGEQSEKNKPTSISRVSTSKKK